VACHFTNIRDPAVPGLACTETNQCSMTAEPSSTDNQTHIIST
jgi:hypothetical protein